MASKNLFSRHYNGRLSAKKVRIFFSDNESVFQTSLLALESLRKLQLVSLVKFAFGGYPTHFSGNIIFFISFIISSPFMLSSVVVLLHSRSKQ